MTATSRRSSSACPYAEALLVSEAGSSDRSESSSSAAGSPSSTSPPHPVVPAEALQACPAFSSGSCPFKDAQSAEQVQEALLQVPPSHFERDAGFVRVLQGLHSVQSRLLQQQPPPPQQQEHQKEPVPSFRLPGGCPVQSLLPPARGGLRPEQSFTEALEECSLSALVARLAAKLERERRLGDAVDAVRAAAFQDAGQEDPSPRPDGEDVDDADDKDAEGHSVGASTAPAAGVGSPEGGETNGLRLSAALKTGTAESHQAAEDVHFVSNFVRGKIDRELYGQLVGMLYHVYDALEDCLDRHGPKHFASCHFPLELSRREPLRDDVDFWHGSSRGVPPPMTPATTDYVNRLHHVAATNPLLLLSHAYTRYLGDLSGGRILARVARRALHLDKDGSGLAFYEFQNINSPKAFKDQYRSALDALPLTPRQIKELVAEANVSFGLNVRLFEELDVMAGVPGAVVRPLSEVLAYADLDANAGGGKSERDVGVSGDAAKCPFAALGATGAGATAAHPPLKAAADATARQCPWPFVLLHDPARGFRDARTWAAVGLLLCYAWSTLLAGRQ